MIQHQFTIPQDNQSIATDSEAASNIENSHMTMGLETLGAGPVEVVGVDGEELVLVLIGSDAFA